MGTTVNADGLFILYTLHCAIKRTSPHFKAEQLSIASLIVNKST